MPRDLVLEPFVRGMRAGALSALASSPWAPVVAVGSQHQVLLYNPQSLSLLGVIPFLEGEPQVVKFSRSGSILLVGGGQAAKSGKVVLWDVPTGNRITDVGDEFDAVLAADISADQTRVALGGPGKVLKIFSTKDGALIDAVKKHTDWVTAIAYSADNALLASGDRAGGLWVWEAKNNREFYNLAGHKAGITAVAFRGDSNILASSSEDGFIKLWDMNSGKEAKTWQAHAGGVLSMAFARDGKLVSCGRDHLVRVWKADGSQLQQFEAFGDIALHCTFDDEGARVIAGDWTGQIRVWNVSDGKRVGELAADPPPLAEQIDATNKRIITLQNVADQASAEVAAANDALNKSNQDLGAAQNAVATGRKEVEQMQAAVNTANGAAQAAAAAFKAAQDAIATRQAELAKLTQANQQAVAARRGG